MSIPEIRTLGEALLLTIRKQGSWRVLELGTPEISTAEEVSPAAVDSPTTQILERA